MAAAHAEDGREGRVLLCVTGSVAAVKAAEVCLALRAAGLDVRVALTPSAERFVAAAELRGATGAEVFTDEDEWAAWRGRGDPVTHIELRRWADVLLFAPLSANSLAKLASGVADSLPLCVARAWDVRARRPIVAAPAMNTLMWEHPYTERQIDAVARDLGVAVVPPVTKVLMCGDTGVGAMAAVGDIVAAVTAALEGSGQNGNS